MGRLCAFIGLHVLSGAIVPEAALAQAGHSLTPGHEGEEEEEEAAAALEEARAEVHGHPNLLPRTALAPTAGWILPREPENNSPESRGERALEEYFDEQLDQDRLDATGANPWYEDVARSMRRGFRPDLEAVREFQNRRSGILDDIYNELRRYGAGAAPPQGPPPVVPLEALPLSGEEAARALENERRSALNAPTTWYQVHVRITQNQEGELISAWVIRSSGYPSLDRNALSAVRTGTVVLPPAPPHLFERYEVVRSDWSFEAGDVATDMTQLGCVEDPVNIGEYQCFAMGRGVVRTRVRLLRVVDSDHPLSSDRRQPEGFR